MNSGAYTQGGQPGDPLPDPPPEVAAVLLGAFEKLAPEHRAELLARFQRAPAPFPPARPVALAAGSAPGPAQGHGLLHTGPDGGLYYTSPAGAVTKLAEG